MCSMAFVRVTLFSGRGLRDSCSARDAAVVEEKGARGLSADRAEGSRRKTAETDAATRAKAARNVGLDTASAPVNHIFDILCPGKRKLQGRWDRRHRGLPAATRSPTGR